MYRGSDYYANPQNGWNTTTDEYYTHVSRMERMPSDVTGVPHYPNVHTIFNNRVTYEEEQGNPTQKHQKHHDPEDHKKVRFAEQEKTITDQVDNKKGKHVVIEESVDVEADGFIQKKHKYFEMCKWGTFKVC